MFVVDMFYPNTRSVDMFSDGSISRANWKRTLKKWHFPLDIILTFESHFLGFICLLFFFPFKTFLLKGNLCHYQWRAAQFNLKVSSALMVFEQ